MCFRFVGLAVASTLLLLTPALAECDIGPLELRVDCLSRQIDLLKFEMHELSMANGRLMIQITNLLLQVINADLGTVFHYGDGARFKVIGDNGSLCLSNLNPVQVVPCSEGDDQKWILEIRQ